MVELASTGLQNLSEDFGLHCPNVRILNLNYNALRDLRPLLGIARLEKLYVAGNRIDRLRRTATILSHLSKVENLEEVDMRNNPLTVGFYTPQFCAGDTSEKRMVVSDPIRSSNIDNDDTWDWESEDRNAAKAYCLPYLDKEVDTQSRERLDEDTKLRRRVYEMLAVGACKGLRRLDGVEGCGEDVGRRDGVWDRLVELGVLRRKGGEAAAKEVDND